MAVSSKSVELVLQTEVAPDTISYSAAIGACEEGGQWQSALNLLSLMHQAKVVPETIFVQCSHQCLSTRPSMAVSSPVSSTAIKLDDVDKGSAKYNFLQGSYQCL
eukprot:TRINITY_DN16710_c0_g1_i2.p1 TRINITY_DN16710_c0_g1~~TRINITY_DN16710_c0_g1_i2.p1  ORF type:complete len:105 (+),score=15.00 TRINITY_DN16710_c0_g1_i2:127-441(+)